MRQRRLLAVVGLTVLLAASYLPATSGRARHVADRLAAEHDCPHPLPRVAADSVSGLTPLEKCGVLSAGLAVIDDRLSREAARAGVRDTTSAIVIDRIWVFDEIHVAITTKRYRFRSRVTFDPPRSLGEQMHWGSYWVFSASGGPPDARMLATVWVDQWTGAAHVVGRVAR